MIDFSYPTQHLPRAHGEPLGTGKIRQNAQDFVVEEILGYEPDGQGEHDWLEIRKIGWNTSDLAKRLSQFANVRPVAVGYAGLKDKIAVTTQAFSVQLPGKASPDWQQIEAKNTQERSIEVLKVARHSRKIRRGSLKGNRFRLIIREFSGDCAALCQRCEQIAALGVPNYFGEQRFGNEGSNLKRLARFFSGEMRPRREQKSLLLSSARSFLFNQVLAKRVEQGSWQQILPGEIALLAGSDRQFGPCEPDHELVERCQRLDIHPTGPLPGKASRSLVPSGALAELEKQILTEYSAWLSGLEHFAVERTRRALRLPVQALQANCDGSEFELAFSLESGAYATSVLRELVGLIQTDV